MNQPYSSRSVRLRRMLLPGLIALLLTLFTPSQAVLAHPLDVYLQATYITVAPAQIVVELDLSPGALVVPQILPQLDTDEDQQISESEGQSYVNAVLQNVELQVDGQTLVLAVTKVDMPEYLTIQAGYGTIRVFTIAQSAEDVTGTHKIYYKNNYAPTGSAYQVNAFIDKGATITLGKQNRDSIQQSMAMDYVLDVAPTVATPLATQVTNSSVTTDTATDTPFSSPAVTSDRVGQLLNYLSAPTVTPWTFIFALGLAAVLGGLHALTLGHGKTLVAAYLVGSRGTVRHALLLGSIVTFTHTASVIVIGLLALFASQFVVPNVLMPILEVLSGLLVIFLGIRLVWQRWTALHNHQTSNQKFTITSGQRHDYVHKHDSIQPYALLHDHGDGHTHSHLPQTSSGDIKLSSLVTMGISGGLLPCPEALGIMIIAIGLNRILLGMGLIVSFSFGLAAVLIVIGILLVRSRSLVERFGGKCKTWSTILPLVSAVIVTALGVGIALNGLVTYLK